MIEIKAPSLVLPEEAARYKTLFLGGGISNCPMWQNEMLKLLASFQRMMVFNPRRKDFDTSDLQMEEGQIRWEYFYLNMANMIMFWFPAETLCPITLYELGSWVKTNKRIFVGHHPNYARKRDLHIQLKLARPSLVVATELEEMAFQISCHLRYEALRDR